ncbi:BRCA1-A complex subunit RAP80 [Haplochromis burtoni]|uniref:BRCA1-A complex subunit RAP80 n=1 Tax=Haplochromis burtoni TaxID=8153 RepID=UPI001C2D436A|nr:BRCA1-A complex subunit RAP80 [Haplochromis burtoni]
MRGGRRRGGGDPPSSGEAVTQEQSKMALRKQKLIDVASESQKEEDSQEDEAADEQDELSTSLLATSMAREKQQRESKSKPKEMSEEEMMDLALRLSEQEASATALRRQQEEEEAMMRAIKESMVGQTQACRTPKSPSQPTDVSLRLCSRRKLAYSNGKTTLAIDRGASEDGCLQAGSGDGDNGSLKRKRKAGSPLPEMPDLSQTQVYSQASPCSSESLPALPDSPQSSGSTQIEDSQLHRSPVFPLTGCRAEVRIGRLSQDLLDTCRSSGFVLCSQNGSNATQKSPRPESPTFPDSDVASCPKSPALSGPDPDNSDEIEPSPECAKSPVFGRNAQHESSPSARRPRDAVHSQDGENSGFTFSSQDSLTPSVRPTSPVFPRSPGIPPSERLAFPESPNRGQAEPSHAHSESPVFGLQQQRCESPPANRKDGQSRLDGLKASESDELSGRAKAPNPAESQLTSDMTLVWSDGDEDVTPTGSPSPVFPEETSVHQAESPPASLNHVAASSGATGSNCSLRPQSSSNRQASPETSPKSGTEELWPDRSRTLSSVSSGESADSTTVHYYWGVPFCPRGLDPDTYTQVIVAQMEVYEKTLNRAQRRLLRKAAWGEAVLPQTEESPSHELPAGSPQCHAARRRGLRLRSKTQDEAADTPTAEEKEEEQTKTENKEEDGKKDGDEEPMDAEDCEVCPETQLSGDSSQDVTLVCDAEDQPAAKTPEIQMILHADPPSRSEPQVEEVEADAPTGEQMEADVPVRSSEDGAGQPASREEVQEDGGDPDVEEIKDQAPSPGPEPAVVPRSPETAVDCPLCQASFPASRIEMHAAYCDGEVAVVEERRPKVDYIQVSRKTQRKRTHRANAEDTNDGADVSRNQEKCYICQRAVPLKDYSRHTELCIQRHGSKTAARGNLLLALDQTESRDSDAGPSGSKVLPGDVIDLRDDDDDEEEVSAFRVSNSPIRSFTPISEAADCLIDFKKQQRAKKPYQRRR